MVRVIWFSDRDDLQGMSSDIHSHLMDYYYSRNTRHINCKAWSRIVHVQVRCLKKTFQRFMIHMTAWCDHDYLSAKQ